ncbi:MAG: SDR family NAD(P)-dependent oxidoreductase, partial [Myxococcales bacterium]|nr:SDR family NAD(P)-dependent oxidoreductase [Myxococcales bacterium]
ADLCLAGRDADALSRIAADARVRSGRPAVPERFDAREVETHEAFLDACSAHFGGFDGVVVCHGAMVEQALAEEQIEPALAMFDVNVTGTVSLLERIAGRFEAGRFAAGGFLVALGSVAGDRGRRRNYLYGATKAALATVLAGQRVRLAPLRVCVTEVRPGPVDTRMTFGRSLPGTASPERVARDVLRAVRRRRGVVYTPWPWRGVMWVVRWLPAGVVARLDR